MTETLYLVDGSGFIFRAFHALPMLTRADGTPINAVLGYCNMLTRLLQELQAERIAVIFDAGRQTFRQEIYPAYKAHRPPPPPELVPQFALIREATRAFGLPSLELVNYEADDLIASYAHAATAAGWQTKIISADKDLMQLVSSQVSLLDPIKFRELGTADVQEKFGVSPEFVVEVQALAGDSTDNIPGVPGIGIKTAAELINRYGSLENLLAHTAEISQPKRRELLETHAELARISRQLVLLRPDVPLPAPLDELRPHPDQATLQSFLQHNQFRGLLQKFGLNAPAPVASPAAAPTAPAAPADIHYDCIQTTDQLELWIGKILATGVVVIDTETTGLTPCMASLVGIALATAPGVAAYIPIAHGKNQPTDLLEPTAPPPKQLPLSTVVAALKPVLANPAIKVIGHNLKYDWQILAAVGLYIASYEDTMLMSYALAAGQHGHGLDELALKHFGHAMTSFADVTGKGKTKISFAEVALPTATHYAAEDADYTFRLWQLLAPQLPLAQVASVYQQLDKPLIPVIAAMEQAGVTIDLTVLQRLSHQFGQQLQILEQEIHTLAGQPFNVGSPKQLGDILFGALGLPGGTRGKNGAYSTGSEILEPLAEQGHAIAAKVLDWRGLAKLQSTYTDALPAQINPRTGRVHTSYMLTGAATGRLSSSDPNVQNIPIRTADGKAIRAAFVAAPGQVLVSVDYSQIELRLVAEIAGIAALQQAFRDGLDIHQHTAALVFGLPLSEVTPSARRAAKAINFGIIYGISAFGLAKQLGCSNQEAQQFIRDYLNRYHELRDWMEATKASARQHGYVTTLFGRKIHVPGIAEKNPARRAFAERQAINAPMQGTAADLIKRAMIRLPAALAAYPATRLLLQVHDELVLETPISDATAIIPIVKAVMTAAAAPTLHLTVPLVAEAGQGSNWASAH